MSKICPVRLVDLRDERETYALLSRHSYILAEVNNKPDYIERLVQETLEQVKHSRPHRVTRDSFAGISFTPEVDFLIMRRGHNVAQPLYHYYRVKPFSPRVKGLFNRELLKRLSRTH